MSLPVRERFTLQLGKLSDLPPSTFLLYHISTWLPLIYGHSGKEIRASRLQESSRVLIYRPLLLMVWYKVPSNVFSEARPQILEFIQPATITCLSVAHQRFLHSVSTYPRVNLEARVAELVNTPERVWYLVLDQACTFDLIKEYQSLY